MEHDRERTLLFFILQSTIQMGAVGNRKLYEYLEEWTDLYHIDLEILANTLGLRERAIRELQKNLMEKEKFIGIYQDLRKRGIGFVHIEDESYPGCLKHIYDYPLSLFYKGSLPGARPRVAVVGSRNATNYGKDMTKYIVSELAKRSIDIVSGMALGIDAVAHRTALEYGAKTYAVLGNGINICYPKENYDIYEAISDGNYGGILSEFPLGTSPIAHLFPMRNRLISGLADIVLIMEARERSGSLITANLANEQGKLVYALPGRITDPLSRGCNNLISNGASILSKVDDVIESLGMIVDKSIPIYEKNLKSLAKNEKLLYSCLDLKPKFLEDIIEETGIPHAEVMNILLNLELKGFITQISGNYYGIRYR